MSRKVIPLNTARQLWAQCGGFCQKPDCNKPLFRAEGTESVSLANVAHIVGQGVSGPRADHELAEYIDRDGVDNLVMLCLECHKIVDELERKFPVDEMKEWKRTHGRKIASLFSVPSIADEMQLLCEVNDLLESNAVIFREYGPYSDNMLKGEGGDGPGIWRKRCFDNILPNNQRIIQLIEKNKRNFPYPWDVYGEMLSYRVHADAFQDNCLTGQKVNDYKLFPRGFEHFVKTKLGIPSRPPELRAKEELEFRSSQIRTYIDRFLSSHSDIGGLQELNRGTMLVELRNGKSLKVFVTNTYYFTEYTLERVLEVDPAVDAIICSCPAGGYSESAKRQCIETDIGLFMLGEFMGAIRHRGEQYLNFLLRSEKVGRVSCLKRLTEDSSPPPGVTVYAFGSHLRRKLYRDVDMFIVYKEPTSSQPIKVFESTLAATIGKRVGKPDITVASQREFAEVRFKHDNLTQVFP
jgi:hypothetical protein